MAEDILYNEDNLVDSLCAICDRMVTITKEKAEEYALTGVVPRCLEHSPEFWEPDATAQYAAEEESVLSTIAFNNESSKVFVGKFFSAGEFSSWLQAQSRPAWAKFLCIHHTWSPTPSQWHGYQTLKGVFNYYNKSRGWPAGVGPHFWIGQKTHGGEWGIWVATHPARKGIGAAGWNSDTLHVETIWNGDIAPFGEVQLQVGYRLMQALNLWIKLPIQPCRFVYDSPKSWNKDGWATKDVGGMLMHRHTRNANKTCPGTKNTAQNVFRGFQGSGSSQRVLNRATPPMEGEDVKKLQSVYKSLGWDLDVTGKYDHRTWVITHSYQASKQLKIDGIVGKETWDKVLAPQSDRLLKEGMQGPDVHWVQKVMRKIGMKRVPLTSKFDLATKFKVKEFQDSNGLVKDGIVGPKTWAMLRKRSN